MSPRLLFRIFAFAELVTWAGLIAALVLRGVGVTDALVGPAGGVHGFVFLSYCVITVLIWIDARWRPGVGVLGLACAVVPFATLPFELVADRKGLLPARWRLGADGQRPLGFFEGAVAFVLRRPWVSVIALAVLVTIVFVVLLWLGPPIPTGGK